jgi:hypothetical protein
VVKRGDERDQVVARPFGRHLEELVNAQSDVVEGGCSLTGACDRGRVWVDARDMASDAGEALHEQTLTTPNIQDATRPPPCHTHDHAVIRSIVVPVGVHELSFPESPASPQARDDEHSRRPNDARVTWLSARRAPDAAAAVNGSQRLLGRAWPQRGSVAT